LASIGSIGGERTVVVASMENFYRCSRRAVQAGVLHEGHPISYKIRPSEERCSAAKA
jgi:hypothetical protein